MPPKRRRIEFEANGLLIVDKPQGLSSNQVLNQVKWMTKPRKLGHAGTLDPFATGVLVLCFNEATKVAGYLLDHDKTYEGVMYLGVETDTQDLTGRVLRKRPVKVTEEEIMAAADNFRGRIQQKPPAYSALKRGGEALYKKARRGEEVVTEPRPVTVHNLEVTGIEGPRVHFTVRCSKGFYVRTLAHDWGRALGCGAHLEALRRTESGPFAIEQGLILGQVEITAKRGRLENRLIPPVKALDWDRAELDEDAVRLISQGQTLAANQLKGLPTQALAAGRRIMLTDHEGELVALAELAMDEEGPGLKAQSLRVLRT